MQRCDIRPLSRHVSNIIILIGKYMISCLQLLSVFFRDKSQVESFGFRYQCMRLPIGFCVVFLRVFSVLLIVAVFASKTWAQSTTEGDLLSYSELMRLPHAKRVAYIEGVRKILIELSKDPEARFSDSDPRARSKLKVWLEFLNQNFTDEALASSPNLQLCLTSNQCKSALRSCFEQNQGIIWQESVGTYRCNPAEKVGAKTQGANSVFSKVDEQAFLQYAESIADPRGRTNADAPVGQTGASVANNPTGTTSGTVRGGGADPAIQITGPVEVSRPQFFNSSPPKLTGSQARTIQEYVELLATGKIVGKRYTCRSKHQNRTLKNDSGEAIDHSNFPKCTEDQEGRIQALFDRVNSGRLPLFAPGETAPSILPANAVAETFQPASEAVQAAAFPVAPPPVQTSTFGRRISRQEIQPYLDERKSPDVICESERQVLGDGELVFIPMDAAGSFGRCMSETNAKLFQAGSIERHPSDSVPTAPPSSRPSVGAAPPQPPAALAPFAKCAPKPESCGDRESVRKAYYQGNLPCVFAGMISNLDGQNRRCQAVTSYKVGDENLKCDVGQAMCNPLLFGTVLGSSPTKAICVGRGQDVTSQCGKLSNARDAELFINRNAAGLQEKWDEFKEKLESVCKSETISAKFHCQECNVMKHRLFELHAKLVGNPCETTLEQGIKTRIQIRSRAIKK